MKYIFAILAAFALMGCPAPISFRASVVFLGDSITAGNTLPSRADGWVSKYLSQMGIQGVNSGVSGNTTVQMLARLKSDVIAYSPRVVFIMGGINDIRMGSTASDIESHLEQIYTECASSKVVPCTLTPFPSGTPDQKAEVQEINTWIRSVSPCVDFYTANPEISIDGLHPDMAGNTTMADVATSFSADQQMWVMK